MRDRVTVMRDGRYIDTRACSSIRHDELITLIVGREVSNMFPKEQSEIGAKSDHRPLASDEPQDPDPERAYPRH